MATYSIERHVLSEEAVREITDNINKLEQTISSIGKKYTKKK